jgi:allophanate hydrolase subunit 2
MRAAGRQTETQSSIVMARSAALARAKSERTFIAENFKLESASDRVGWYREESWAGYGEDSCADNVPCGGVGAEAP